MKIFVLGSEGFIGNACIYFFQQKGYDVFGADVKDVQPLYPYLCISDFSKTIPVLFQNNQFDFCINAAGSGNVPFSLKEPLADFNANCNDVVHILDAIRKSKKACRYLHISSAAVYGNPARLPVCETGPAHPTSPYGWHKLISENLCREYAGIYGLHTCCIRPFSVFGPGLRKQIFWDTFQKSLLSSTVEIWGTGKESRDYIYINDLLHAIECIVGKSQFDGCVYNVANGKEIFIGDVIPLFLKLVDPSLTHVFNNIQRPGDPLNWCADISALAELGYENHYSLEAGLVHTVAWLKKENEEHR